MFGGTLEYPSTKWCIIFCQTLICGLNVNFVDGMLAMIDTHDLWLWKMELISQVLKQFLYLAESGKFEFAFYALCIYLYLYVDHQDIWINALLSQIKKKMMTAHHEHLKMYVGFQEFKLYDSV